MAGDPKTDPNLKPSTQLGLARHLGRAPSPTWPLARLVLGYQAEAPEALEREWIGDPNWASTWYMAFCWYVLGSRLRAQVRTVEFGGLQIGNPKNIEGA